jgi:autotransporter-associated beta strand protein
MSPRASAPKPFAARAAVWISALCLSVSPAFSAIVYWDGDGVDIVGGGPGTWDTTSPRWSTTPDGSTYQVWNNANNDDAVFTGPGTATTVTIGTAITVSSITLAVGNYTLSGAAQTLSSNSGTLTIDAQAGVSIVNALYSSSLTTIVKNGTGLLSSGTPQTTFAGKWVVNAGILSLPNDNRSGAVPTTLVPDNFTLDNGFLRSSTANVNFNANRGITLGQNGGGFDATNTSITWNGPITGILGGALTKRSSFNLILTNNTNNYDGPTLVNAGRLTVGAPNALGTTAGDTQVQTNATLIFDGATSNFTINEPIQIAGVGAGTDGGAISVRNGANVTLGGPITLSSDASVTVDGTSTATYSNANSFTSSADQTLTLNGDALTTGSGGTITGAISLGNGGLIKAQGGKWTLAGTSTYFGLTNVSGGTLIVSGSINGTSQVDVAGTLGGGGSIILGNGGSVSLADGGKLSPGNGTGTLSVTLSGGGAFDIASGVFGANSQALIFELGAPGASDKVALTAGSLSIGTGVLEFDDFALTAVAGFLPVADYTLFDGNLPILGTLGVNRTGLINGFLAELRLADSDRDIVLHVIPEPASGLVLAAGAMGLVGLRRRSRSSIFDF